MLFASFYATPIVTYANTKSIRYAGGLFKVLRSAVIKLLPAIMTKRKSPVFVNLILLM